MHQENTPLKINIVPLVFLFLIWNFSGISIAGDESLTESIITLPVQANLMVLENHLNNIIPNTLADINEPNKVLVKSKWLKTKGIPKCSMKKFKIYCKDRWIKTKITPEIRGDIKGWVKRNGHISVSGKGSTLQFAFPIKAQISAKAGIRETANAAATIYVNATPRINNDWSISVDVSPDLSWSQRPTLKLFGIIKVTIGSKVEPKIREKMNEFVREIPKLLANLKLKEKLEVAWSDIQEPLRVNNEPEVYLFFNPENVSYSGFNIVNNILKTTVAAKGKTQVVVGKPSGNFNKKSLPKLGSMAYEEGTFNFYLPIFIPYQELLAISAKRSPSGYSVELGKGLLKVSNPKIMKSSDGGISISANINFDNRSKWLKIIDIFNWFDVDGEITFKGSPRIEKSTRTVVVDKLEYDSTTNSKLFDALVDIAGIQTINDYLRSQIKYAFGPKIDNGIVKANEDLNVILKNGVTVTSSLQAASVEQITVNEQNIRIDTKLSGIVNAQIGL